MSNLKIGIIGAGKMAGAIVKGWVTSGLVPAAQVGVGKRKLLKKTKTNTGDMLKFHIFIMICSFKLLLSNNL